jgi:uncharacterized membrane protein YeiH
MPAPRSLPVSPDRLVLGFDLVATFVFGLEGASAAVNANLDVFGALVLGFVTALGGGIIRDLLIGDTPPAAFRDQHYMITALVGALVATAIFAPISHVPRWVLTVLDAGGLSLFAVSGATKALEFGANDLTAMICGIITAVGGGAIRDVLLNVVPQVLRTSVYASAALFGTVVMLIGIRAGQPRGRMMCIGGVACLALRLVAAWQHWNLPHAESL